MASDTAPAAVPGPNNDSATPASPPSTGGLTGMLTPVTPARSATFNLDPQTTAQETAGHTQAAVGASSATYSSTDQPENARNSAGNASRQERSVIRAWLLAGARRWEKGADARNKRLDIKKARAQARQVKETITVNRSEKTGGGPSNSSTGSNSGSGKSLTSKSNKASSGAGPKNSPSKGSSGGYGSSGGRGSRTPSDSGTNRSATSRTDKAAGPKNSGGAKPVKDNPGNSPSSSGASGKTNSGSGTGSSGTGGSSAGGHQQAADKTKSGDSSSSPKPGKGTGSSNGGGGAQGGKTGPQGNPGKSGKDAPDPSGKTDSSKPGKTSLEKTTAKGSGESARQTGPDAKPSTTAADSDHTTRKDPSAKDGKSTKGDETDKSAKAPEKRSSNETRNPASVPAPRTRINTQASREAGYRDGTRIGKVVAHTQAYRNGYRDGRTDTQEAAAHDKARLDKAREDRKTARTQPDKDRPVTQPASSADYQPTVPPKPDHAPGPQPVQVTSTDTTHIHLGTNAARPHVSRGEVRTLRQFQQRLGTKTDTMTGVAEATRVLEQHATEQAKQVTQLLEQARGVEGGDKLVTALTRLAEAAQVQAGKAAEIHKRALRASEACTVLSANTETRYDGIYQAVVDSPETSPAEMRYYREMGYASV